MSKHTPGRWSVEGDVIFGANDNGIAQLWQGSFEPCPKGEAQANARLIAAAPEMFDALRELTIAAEAAGWDIGDNASVLNAARAAIAKAEGGAS